VRPAGTLGRLARRRLGQAVSHLAAGCDMVVIDLSATDVAAPRALAGNLRALALELARAGRCLLPPGLVARAGPQRRPGRHPRRRLAAPPGTSAAGRVNGRDRLMGEAEPAMPSKAISGSATCLVLAPDRSGLGAASRGTVGPMTAGREIRPARNCIARPISAWRAARSPPGWTSAGRGYQKRPVAVVGATDHPFRRGRKASLSTEQARR
jgi:hypothetical protein